MNNILHIEDHPRYDRNADVVGGRPLSNLDMTGLLLYTRLSGIDLTSFWKVVTPDGKSHQYKKGNNNHVFPNTTA
jgi:hypothetical protein